MPPKEAMVTAASGSGAETVAEARSMRGPATAPGLEDAVVARARADAQRHVALWRDRYEGSLEVFLSWHLSSQALDVGACFRARYMLALAAEARRLQRKMVVRASAAAVGWTEQHTEPLGGALCEPARSFLDAEWRVVAHEIGAEVENEELRLAFARFVRTAVARELAYLAVGRTAAQLGLGELDA